MLALPCRVPSEAAGAVRGAAASLGVRPSLGAVPPSSLWHARGRGAAAAPAWCGIPPALARRSPYFSEALQVTCWY